MREEACIITLFGTFYAKLGDTGRDDFALKNSGLLSFLFTL
jgi:hypothetical protein